MPYISHASDIVINLPLSSHRHLKRHVFFFFFFSWMIFQHEDSECIEQMTNLAPFRLAIATKLLV